MNNVLLLIDGNALMHRAYHALPPFKTKQGLPTNAVYGFLSMVHKAIADFKPTHLAVCFDTPAPTFRKKIFKAYQAHRPKLEDNLKLQMPLVREALDKGGIIRLEKPGYEADDIIGTIINKLKKSNTKVLIFTGDKDIFQLVSAKVFVIAPLIGLANVKLYDTQEVKKRLSVAPDQIPDYKALMGDPSDNYSGAKGIGPKTAVQLLEQFHTIEKLFVNLDKVDNQRIKKILKKNKENVFLSKKLAQIHPKVEIEFNFHQTRFTQYKEALKDYLLSLDIKTLTDRLFTNPEKNKSNQSTNEKKVKNDSNKQIGLF